mgnify:CR=1 FL=1
MITLKYVQDFLEEIGYTNIKISQDTKISQLEFDSLEFFELINAIERDYDVGIKLDQINVTDPISKIIDLVNDEYKL